MRASVPPGGGVVRLGPLSLIVPVALAGFVLAASTVAADSWPTTALRRRGAGRVAVWRMARAAGRGARWTPVESRFGGLARVYGTRKWRGVWAMAFGSVHLLFKAGAPCWEVAPTVQLPGPATRFVRQAA